MIRANRPLRYPGAIVVLVAVYLLAVAAGRAQSVQEPAPGVLLVAAERMGDPRFNEAVILLIEHGQSGSWGLIINKPTEIEVPELLPSLPSSDAPVRVYYGGPVKVDHLSLIYRADARQDGAGSSPLPGVHWSDSEEVLEERLTGRAADIRVYAGYAGWAPGQLDYEIESGGWRMIQGGKDKIFSDEPGGLWERLDNALDGIAI